MLLLVRCQGSDDGGKDNFKTMMRIYDCDYTADDGDNCDGID
jgi:hypothetical protein